MSFGQREVRRSSSMFTRGFAAAISPDARRGSVLGFGASSLPVLQVRAHFTDLSLPCTCDSGPHKHVNDMPPAGGSESTFLEYRMTFWSILYPEIELILVQHLRTSLQLPTRLVAQISLAYA